MASVYERKSEVAGRPSRWVVRWTDPDDPRKRPTKLLDDKGAAERYAIKIEREIEAGVRPSAPATETTFASYVTTWWEDKLHNVPKTKKRITPGTVSGYKIRLRCRITPFFGKRRLDTLTPRVVKDWLLEMREDGVSESNLNGDWRLLKQILDYAVADDEMIVNPCDKIKKELIPVQDPQERDWLRENEIWPFEQLMTTTMDKAIFFLGAMCGLRASEIVALRWVDVDLEEQLIYIRMVKTQFDDQPRFGTKNGDALRIVPIPEILVELLEKWSETKRKVESISGLVFPNRRGQCINWHNWYNRHFAPAADAFGRPKLVFHGLRHTANTHLLNHFPPHVVRKIIGHKTKEMQELYTHVEIQQMQDAMRQQNNRIAALRPVA